MAYKDVLRVEISEVIRRWRAGHSQRRIASGTGLSRDTVARYITAAEALGVSREGGELSEGQLSRLAAIGQPGPRRVETPSEDLLAPWADQIHRWLTGDRLQLTRVQELLAGRGCRVSYASLQRFLARREHVLLVGPAGVGKSFLAQALGYSAVRAGHTVRFSHADDYFRVMNQARADNSLERSFRTSLAPDLLILDDLGLHRFTAQQSGDLYELILNRHRASSFVITSNRAVDEWLGLFEDPILGNSALDRLANASHQITIEGQSYRERLSPHRALLEAKGVIDRPTAT